jgi:hypothetical protein
MLLALLAALLTKRSAVLSFGKKARQYETNLLEAFRYAQSFKLGEKDEYQS